MTAGPRVLGFDSMDEMAFSENLPAALSLADQFDFLSWVWDRQDRNGWVSVGHKTEGEGGQIFQEFFKWPGDRKKVHGWLDAHEGDAAYFCHPIMKRKGRQKDDASPSRFLHQDFDEVNPLSLEERFRPSIVWETSPGRWQGLYLLPRPLGVAQFEEWNEALANHLGADRGWDIVHFIRVPGRANPKPKYKEEYGPEGAPGRLHIFSPDEPVNLIRWSDIRSQASSTPNKTETIDVPPVEGVDALPSALRRKLLREEIDSDRSDYVHGLAKDLIKAGFDPALIFHSPAYQDKFGGRSAPMTELAREVRKARTEVKKEKPSGKLTIVGERDPWAPFDLSKIFADPPPTPKPTGLLGALYPGKLHWVQGEPESGKSFLMFGEVVHAIKRGDVAMVLDEEAGAEDVTDKLRALGASEDDIRERLVYFDPFGRDVFRDFDRLAESVERHHPSLIMFDSIAAFLSNSDLNEDKATDVTGFIVRVLLPLAHTFGSSVVVLDHLTKSQTDSRYARGSTAKLAKTDVAWRVAMPRPFNRNRSGQVQMTCTKDRPGTIGRDSEISVQVLVREGLVDLLPTSLSKDEADAFKASSIKKDRIVAALDEAASPMTIAEIAAIVYPGQDPEKNRGNISKRLNELLGEGEVSFDPGPKNAKLWSRADPTPNESESA